MKNTSIFILILYLVANTINSFSQDQSLEKQKSTEKNEPNKQNNAEADIQVQLTAFYKSYLEIKDALIISDPIEVIVKANNAKKKIEIIDVSRLKNQEQIIWKDHLDKLKATVVMLSESKTLEEQRLSFSNLSNDLYITIKEIGVSSGPVNYVFCPMALQGEGAYWLSDEKEIKNPYFGSKMLKCGSIKEEIIKN